jgi:hypothetical protein
VLKTGNCTPSNTHCFKIGDAKQALRTKAKVTTLILKQCSDNVLSTMYIIILPEILTAQTLTNKIKKIC